MPLLLVTSPAWFLSTIAARTAIVLLVLIGGLRLLGKRQIGQMNIYDLAMIMALANAVQNAMTNGKGDLGVGLVSAGTLLGIGALLTLVFVRLPKLEERLVGTPTLIVNDGKILPDRMRRECVTQDELMQVLREHGLTDIREVLLATLEVDGTISIVPKTADHERTKKRVQGGSAPKQQAGS
jgi:uncharacterized membrane protein YcaP (DUF421 family)